MRTDDPTPMPRPRLGPRLAVLAAVAAALVAFYFSGLADRLSWAEVKADLASWQASADENLPLAVAVFVAVYVAVVALSLPVAVVLSLVAGALFGRWLGTAVVSVSATAGATLAFLGSRYLFRDWVRRRFGRLLAPIEGGIQRDGAFYLLTLRLMPVVPFWLINLGMGLTPMRATTFAAVSWAGMLLGTFLYVNAGTELASLDSPRGLFSWRVVGSLALLGVVPLLIRWAVRAFGGGGEVPREGAKGDEKKQG